MPIGSSGAAQSVEVQPGLRVPGEALVSSGGWFDSRNWIFKLVWDRVCQLNTEELEHPYFSRKARHSSRSNHTVYKKARYADPSDHDNVYPKYRDTSNRDHRTQERERRREHRMLCREMDNYNSTLVFEMAKELLPLTKHHTHQPNTYRLLRRGRFVDTAEAVLTHGQRRPPVRLRSFKDILR